METTRLLIRKFKYSDWEDLHEYMSQKQATRFETYDVFSKETSIKKAREYTNSNDFFAVCLKDSGKVIGDIYLAKEKFGTWELGYAFNENFQGKGYATEAAFSLVDNVFKEKNAHRVTAACAAENIASHKLLERLSMRREGHLLQCIYYEKDKHNNPIWSDMYEYGILAHEWIAKYK